LNDRLTLGPVTVQPFVFVDAGILRQRGRLDFAELRVTELWSAGGGARIALPYGLFGEVYSAWPGKSRFTPDGSSDPRIFFSIGATR
ncbi:MAG: hypothetical protein ACT6SC_19600, partial [Blastomonas fulva]